MKTIKFKVEGDRIIKDPTCDFSNFSKANFLIAEFSFSSEWDGFTKVAGFSKGGKELEPRYLINGNTFEVPREAFKGPFFRMYIVGKRGDEKLKTKTTIVSERD